jgi:hypothetical protein
LYSYAPDRMRVYAARMGTAGWQDAFAQAVAEPAPCLMCAETVPGLCHRHLIAAGSSSLMIREAAGRPFRLLG